MKAVFVTLFAGMISCAFTQPVSAANAATFQEKVLYSFCSLKQCRDGSIPSAGLIATNGRLYGTTFVGGDHKGSDHQGGGTVFKLNLSTGAEYVIHGFCRHNYGCSDGEGPDAGLIKAGGKLFGTTAFGGISGCYDGCGTVFSVDPATHEEKVLYVFCTQQNCTDGEGPVGDLVDVNGTLYGTTEGGGLGAGTVFSLDPSTGAEKVVHSFCSQKNCADGREPASGLIKVKGMLYGTTDIGGNTNCNGFGCGTVFSFDPSTGTEKVLYSFCSQQNCADGNEGRAGLIELNGTLYGTTLAGGTGNCGGSGCGTVFSVDPGTGAEKVVYSFCSQQNCADGSNPFAGLISVNGVLYGTTGYGGNTGYGTVFALDPQTGAETVVYAFCSQQNCVDGSKPIASLISVNGVLYGTTQSGGTGENEYYCGFYGPGGCGTVFALTTGQLTSP